MSFDKSVTPQGSEEGCSTSRRNGLVQGNNREVGKGRDAEEKSSCELCGQIGVERSGEAKIKCRVRFVNISLRKVDVFWLDTEGQVIKILSLSPSTSTTLVTYHTHPWIFKDSESGERMAVRKNNNSRSPFFEVSQHLTGFSEETINSLNEGIGVISVCIIPTVDNLRLLALRTVRSNLRRKEDCFKINAPDPLQFELANTFI